MDARASAFISVAFRTLEQRRRSDFRLLSRLNCLPACPLSTLRAQPRDCGRMTRGQVGSLGLTCTTLSFASWVEDWRDTPKVQPICYSPFPLGVPQ